MGIGHLFEKYLTFRRSLQRRGIRHHHKNNLLQEKSASDPFNTFHGCYLQFTFESILL